MGQTFCSSVGDIVMLMLKCHFTKCIQRRDQETNGTYGSTTARTSSLTLFLIRIHGKVICFYWGFFMGLVQSPSCHGSHCMTSCLLSCGQSWSHFGLHSTWLISDGVTHYKIFHLEEYLMSLFGLYVQVDVCKKGFLYKHVSHPQIKVPHTALVLVP